MYMPPMKNQTTHLTTTHVAIFESYLCHRQNNLFITKVMGKIFF